MKNQLETDDTGKVQICTKKVLTLSAILNELDGVGSQHGRIVIMTTNRIGKLDPALIRPGRMDMHLKMEKCSRAVYHSFFLLFFDKNKIMQKLDKLPEHIVTPAEVGGLLLKHRDSITDALQSLSRLLKAKQDAKPT